METYEEVYDQTYKMEKIKLVLDSIVLSQTKEFSEETIDYLFYFYLQQIERIKKSLQTDRKNKKKYDELNKYINLTLRISNENTRLKNDINYEKSISRNF